MATEPATSTPNAGENKQSGDGSGCWVKQLDATSGTHYYYNSVTHECVWDEPDDFVPGVESTDLAAATKIQAVLRGKKVRPGHRCSQMLSQHMRALLLAWPRPTATRNVFSHPPCVCFTPTRLERNSQNTTGTSSTTQGMERSTTGMQSPARCVHALLTLIPSPPPPSAPTRSLCGQHALGLARSAAAVGEWSRVA